MCLLFKRHGNFVEKRQAMGDIDFEEQLELERLEKERLEKEGDHPKEKVDPDGTVYEWDAAKKAWFPKVSHSAPKVLLKVSDIFLGFNENDT